MNQILINNLYKVYLDLKKLSETTVSMSKPLGFSSFILAI